ncbi:TNF receptor-associated factor 6 [Rhipicephalus sanguineus]|uniref:TNF receptor-associated factor 6 n=1 Tax=Rhipicephalus sanguineus TaxID=34632 RepID=UPI001893FCD8|nr:TNF receptor-associated factor 6 [Rhipicephalus sanguineus]
MTTGTRDLGRRALHRVTDSVRGANWRPTVFVDEVTLNRYACCVCHVLPSTTIVLPCSHGVCRQCHAGCIDKDGRSLCPMDGEPFCENECQESKLSARKKQDLKACCWNESYGCDFVGPLAGVLEHYEQECAFHVSPCQKCGEIVMTDMLAAHYIGHLNCRLPSQTLPSPRYKVMAPPSSAITPQPVGQVRTRHCCACSRRLLPASFTARSMRLSD